ncbi:protein EPIDERMAL PATTERNING FACTOR 1 [Cucumis melo var. makuwa]|uniref:Epidermal patterning factor-like protein n=1 Tax=Cucumis melo var. makuwa TaxID=1194695 RepID=A0A5A7SMZ1_CUCMM|nr:protein EPIDERMAL PATTERNING FACTOR 1 [Cucumis melo var. makuwa]TYK07035.1 protein EPIDERMAL PATTERNING FACTOR 1 [Cucumis melo var. makuwa]
MKKAKTTNKESIHSHGHHRKGAASSGKAAMVVVNEKVTMMTMGRKGTETVEVAGSSLPDCSHACGSCSPCRLVMISFVCASLQEAETCPMAYRCMCNNKSYPVP